MSEQSQNTPFIKASSQDQYGKIPLKSWVGKVVAYEAQKDQIEEGWGWRYKVRILGDDSNSQNVADEELSYAICLLPTTAGSGAAYKLRSVRVSQGDMVYGIYGGDGPRIIIGVFPRTLLTDTTSGNFGTLSGFYGALKKNGTLSDEYNSQDGPATPWTTPLDPKKHNLSNRPDPSTKLDELGYDANEDGIIDNAEERLRVPVTPPDKPWDKGDPITSQQVKYILSTTNSQREATEAINQAITQNLITEEVGSEMAVQVANSEPASDIIETGFPAGTATTEGFD